MVTGIRVDAGRQTQTQTDITHVLLARAEEILRNFAADLAGRPEMHGTCGVEMVWKAGQIVEVRQSFQNKEHAGGR